jgi:hypothetical protein
VVVVDAGAVVAAAVDAAAVAAVVVDRRERITMKIKADIYGRLSAVLGIATFALTLASASAVNAQQAFATPDAAAEALVDGIARNDGEQVKTVLGPDYRRYVPQGTSAETDKTRFLEAWSRGHRVASAGDQATLEVGSYGWTLPIPIVKTASGWRFDTKAAPAEMRKRRIGRNELAAIQVALAYTDAQEEYYAKNPDRQGVKHFAMHALSSPGKRDGLYWASLPDEPESPLGAEFADARRGQGYHGYLYRVLTAQGKDAPGGAKSYVRNGLMTDGYALIAWPERYGDTGVMTFIVNRDGIVHEKNLGPDTDAIARSINAYNPDPSWEKVPPPK